MLSKVDELKLETERVPEPFLDEILGFVRSFRSKVAHDLAKGA